MDFKEKMKNFLEEKKSKILSPSSSTNFEEPSIGDLLPTEVQIGQRRPQIAASDLEISQLETDPHADQEIIDGIYKEYYSDEFDPSLYELTRLTDPCDQSSIDRDRKLLLEQLTVVSKKVLKLILDRQGDCTAQMDHVLSVQMDLLDALTTCTTSRKSLAKAKYQFVNCSLGILAGYRRKQQALALVENIKIIQTLERTHHRLEALLKQDKYPEAIKLLLECQSVANNYTHFTAIKQLTVKLQDTLVMTEENLDTALAKVCTNFDTLTYSKIQEAYCLLGKTQTAMDQLLMHITSSIHSRSWSLVQVHAAMSSSCNPEELARRPYPELCQTVGHQLFLPCLIDLIKVLWDIMLNYRKIHNWHQMNPSELHEVVEEELNMTVEDTDGVCQQVSRLQLDEEETKDGSNNQGDKKENAMKERSKSEAEEIEMQLQKQYISKKLDSGLGRIWQEVQTKVRILVQSNNLSQFSIEQFIRFLDTIHTLLQVGKEFCGHDSETLQDSLQKQCLSYFQTYHVARLDELKTHLENEGWTLCPVKLSFSPRSLIEFGHMKLTIRSPSKSPSKRSSISSTEVTGSYFSRYWSDGNPFEEMREGGMDEDILILEPGHSDDEGSSEDDCRDGKADSCDDVHSVPTPRQGFCLANTTLMVLRQFGRYIHLMKLLHPISSQILIGMKELFEFYVFSVYKLFSSQQQAETWVSAVVAKQLTFLLDCVDKDIILKSVKITEPDGEGGSVVREEWTGLVRAPDTSLAVTMMPDLQRSKYKGLLETVVAVESCVYLCGQLLALSSHIKETQSCPGLVDQYFGDQQSVVSSLRDALYLSSINKLLTLDQVLPAISKIKWDLKEVRSQHSEYVDVMVKLFQDFKSRLDHLANSVPIDLDVRNSIWSLAFRSAAYLFVEGFSTAKKCTNEGRALMQLDYRQFVLKTEKISDVRPIPFQDYVTTYIKAFYIPESELEAWVEAHPEYSGGQLTALINAVSYSNNKARQKLNNIVNDLQSKIRR